MVSFSSEKITLLFLAGVEEIDRKAEVIWEHRPFGPANFLRPWRTYKVGGTRKEFEGYESVDRFVNFPWRKSKAGLAE